jgi:hypothetical protein
MSAPTTRTRARLDTPARSRVRELFRGLDARKSLKNPPLHTELCEKVLKLIKKDKEHGHHFKHSQVQTILQIVDRASSSSKKRGSVSAIGPVTDMVVERLAERQRRGYGVLAKHVRQLVCPSFLILFSSCVFLPRDVCA